MSKTLSKVLAVILSLAVLFALPVFAGAEDNYFSFNGYSVKAVSGNWDDDYVGSVEITLNGSVASVATSGVLLTVGSNSSTDNIKTVSVNDASIAISDGKVVITVAYDAVMNHGDTYNFVIAEGAFTSADGKMNSSYTVSVTGNAVIETIEVEDVPLTPIEKLIVWLEEMDVTGTWRDVINFIISILNWFMNI